ncbi:MAG: CCA tRNA nucleotidyltransferase [Rhodospirillales bacterium]|nr:CCA tRNA nucleotidyltransferase [Rhodospirillales bacterium]
MTSPQTARVLDALGADGAEIRFIGGCVRDALLKRPIRDIDIAVPAAPRTVVGLLEAARIRVIPTGIEHGTVTAMIDTTPFEITSLRIDVETYGRRARVAYTDDWLADAARRDFTINAMSCTPAGDVYDYFDGIEDLGHGRIRFVGDPAARLGEDVLRLLRFFRFYAHYGREPVDAAALAACREAAAGLRSLSGERVRVEIFRTLMAGDPADVFALMRNDRVLEHVLPEAGEVGRLRMLSWLDSRALRRTGIAPDPIRRLAALLDAGAGLAEADALAGRLRLSNAQAARLGLIMAPRQRIDAATGPRDLRRALHRQGVGPVRDLLLLAWADALAVTPDPPQSGSWRWLGQLDRIDAWEPPRFPLRGRDALTLGVPHGPRIGQLLRAVEAWWEANDFSPDRTACLARLGEIIAADDVSGSARR